MHDPRSAAPPASGGKERDRRDGPRSVADGAGRAPHRRALAGAPNAPRARPALGGATRARRYDPRSAGRSALGATTRARRRRRPRTYDDGAGPEGPTPSEKQSETT